MIRLTNENFNANIAKGIVVVDFFAVRCWPCKMIAPYLDQMATQYTGKVEFYKVDVDEQPYLSASQGIRAMPTLKVFLDGVVVETIVGADLQKLDDTIQALIKKNETATKVAQAELSEQEKAKKVTIPNK